MMSKHSTGYSAPIRPNNRREEEDRLPETLSEKSLINEDRLSYSCFDGGNMAVFIRHRINSFHSFFLGVHSKAVTQNNGPNNGSMSNYQLALHGFCEDGQISFG